MSDLLDPEGPVYCLCCGACIGERTRWMDGVTFQARRGVGRLTELYVCEPCLRARPDRVVAVTLGEETEPSIYRSYR